MKKIFSLFTVLSIMFIPFFHQTEAITLKPSSYTCTTLTKKDKDYNLSSTFIKKYVKAFESKNYICTKCSGKNYISFSPKNMYNLNKKNTPYKTFDVEIKNSIISGIKIQEKNVKNAKAEVIDKNKKNIYIKSAQNIISDKKAVYITSYIPVALKRNKKIASDSVSVVFSLDGKYYTVELSNPSKSLKSINITQNKKALDNFINTDSFKKL